MINENARHIIYGSGLIGTYLGAILLIKGAKVTLFGRQEKVKTLRNGITLTDFKNNNARIDSIDVCSKISKVQYSSPNFVWLTVKCTALETTLKELSEVVGTNTVIICCQNGVDSHKLVIDAFKNNKVIRAMVPFNVVSESPNHFHKGSEGKLTLESNDELMPIVIELSKLLEHDLLEVDMTTDMTAVQWAKLQLNLGNAVNALADLPVKMMLEHRTYRKIIAAAMRELLAVSNAMNLSLPKVANVPNKVIPTILSLPNFLFSILAKKMLEIDPKVRTSMWWDISNGKKTEIDFLNLKVVEYGRIFDINTPYNNWLVEQIKALESASTSNKVRRDEYQFLKRCEKLLKGFN